MYFNEKHKKQIEQYNDYIYLGSYEHNEIMPNGKPRPKSRAYVYFQHKYCGNKYFTRIDNFKSYYHCPLCCKYENSLEYFITYELNLNINDIWADYNTINPKFISKTNKYVKIWIKCDTHISYKTTPQLFYLSKGKCPYCSNKTKECHPFDSLIYNNPQLGNLIVADENNNQLSNEELYYISEYSSRYFYFKCPSCGKISSKPKLLNNISKRNYYPCEYCSDGYSIPNKIMAQLLSSLNIDYINELSKKDVDWIKDNSKYDFYIPSKNMIIEVNGEQHYKTSNTSNWKNAEYIQLIDKNKKTLATKNGIEYYIEIDCRYTNINYIKNSISKSISDYFDISAINWNDIWIKSQSSLKIQAYNLHKQGYKNYEIAKKLKLSAGCVCSYLKQMKELYKEED